MSNILDTIIAKSDQVTADDLMGGKTLTIKITKVSMIDDAQPVVFHYEGDNGKPFKPSKGMRRVIVQAWGSDIKVYPGRSLTLFRDDKVKWGGAEVGGVRISHMSHLKEDLVMALTVSKANKKPYRVKPLNTKEQPVKKQEEKEETVATEEEISINEPSIIEKEGHDAASKGVASYVEWKNGLSMDQKETIKSFHGKWVKMAKEVDANTLSGS